MRGWCVLSCPVLLSIATLLVTGDASGAAPPDRAFQTPAEMSGFESTPSYAETLDFLKEVVARLPEARVVTFGTSAQGRPMTAIVLSPDRVFDPDEARRRGLPVVMVQAGVHAGEIDGKDACLAVLRDLALGLHREILDGVVILVVPVYNVDGHERVATFNRPNQDGPHAGMGFRTTAAGLDLNRDFVKLASPEARALVALVNGWQPHLHVDLHVTDGVDHDWVLTWAVAEAPQLPSKVDEWVQQHLGAALAATGRAGFRTGPYVELKDGLDPTKGFDSSAAPPARYSTGYFPLRNRPSILIEMHSCKPYRTRVSALREFLFALLAEFSSSGKTLAQAVGVAQAEVVARGRADAAQTSVVLEYEEGGPPDEIAFPIYRWTVATSEVTGKPMLSYERGVVSEIRVPWYHRVRAKTTVPRPRGYLILPGWPQIEAVLEHQGLVVARLRRAVRVDVERTEIDDLKLESSPYQGQVQARARVARTSQTREFEAGTLFVPAAQPDFEVAMQLLEPEAPDSMLSWGMLLSVVEQKEYIDTRNLERWAQEALRDPSVATAWQQALQDPSLAADRAARYRWWYRRTPFWAVQEIGVMPAFRVTSSASASAVAKVAQGD